MTVTGTEVIDRLNFVFSDTANARFTANQKLVAVNVAIGEAWPVVKNISVDSSITLASTTYEYTPSATPEQETGFQVAYVTLTSAPKVLLRRITQHVTGAATWTIHVPPDVAGAYSGETLHLEYYKRIPAITAASGTIDIPLGYLWRAAALVLAETGLINKAQFDTEAYEMLIPVWTREAAAALKQRRRNDLPQMIHFVTEGGTRALPVQDYFNTP